MDPQAALTMGQNALFLLLMVAAPVPVSGVNSYALLVIVAAERLIRATGRGPPWWTACLGSPYPSSTAPRS